MIFLAKIEFVLEIQLLTNFKKEYNISTIKSNNIISIRIKKFEREKKGRFSALYVFHEISNVSKAQLALWAKTRRYRFAVQPVLRNHPQRRCEMWWMARARLFAIILEV